VVIDEAAFLRDETSAQPDVELVRAVMPSLLAARGLLIGISSPYRKVGVLAARHRDYFGRNSNDVLVVKAASTALNPLLDRRMIAKAQRDDPTAARSEWEGEFREDIASLLSDESIDEAIDRARPLELPRVEGVRYAFFTDASAGRRDAFSLAGAHRSGDRCIVDLVRARKAPFDPRTVAREYAEVAKSYGCRSITGDAYAGEWTAAAFRSAGVEYRRSRKVKSELYLAAVAPFQGGRVSLPNVAPMIRQLRLLERRTGPSGKDRVDHRPNDFDDEANSVAGVIDCVLAPSQADLLRNRPVVGPTLIRRPPLEDEFDAPGWREVADVGGAVLGNVPWR
jgi:hypothetical protein